MMFFALACAAGAVYWGIDLAQHYGLAPGDGGVLAPLWQRLAWGGGVALIGLAFLVGMDIYGRVYLASVSFDEQANCLYFETLRWWGRATAEISPADVLNNQFHRGFLQTDAHTVNAPWCSISVKGHKLAYVLDLQGEFKERKLAKRLLKL